MALNKADGDHSASPPFGIYLVPNREGEWIKAVSIPTARPIEEAIYEMTWAYVRALGREPANDDQYCKR